MKGHYSSSPRDRRDDAQPGAGGPGDPKPPVLRRATLRLLSAACLAVIAFGTLGPLGHGRGPWLETVKTWHWVPQPHATNLDDILTNLLVYAPVGVAFRLLVRRRGRAGGRDLAFGFGLSLALSFATEVLQQFMPARSSNLTDVYVNAIGALGGCLLAPRMQRVIRRVHAAVYAQLRCRPWTMLAGLSIVAAAILMTIPWNLTCSEIEVDFIRPFDLADITRFATFGLVGFALTGALARYAEDRSRTIRKVASRLILLAILLEAAQVFVHSHACGVLDVVVAVTGGLAGCATTLLLIHAGIIRTQDAKTRGSGPPVLTGLWRVLAVGMLLLTVFGTVGVSIWSDGRPIRPAGRPDIRWVPFQEEFMDRFPVVIAHAAGSIGLYAFITLLCLLLTRGKGRVAAMLLLTGALASAEVCRALLGDGLADTTPLVLAVAAWLIAGRIWDAIYPPARVSAPQPTDLSVRSHLLRAGDR
ncbi:MAG TPA: VanZ family protein [Phycisphaerae bacterium]|nr:VanZ family protein [Phycisphaerae bacterium]